MMYLDFENEKYEKGFERFSPSVENIKANIGKRICWVTSRDVDSRRGYVFVRYGKIFGVNRGELLLNDGNTGVRIKSILEIGIEICTNP